MTSENFPIQDKYHVEAAKRSIDSVQVRLGKLIIDHEQGTITFKADGPEGQLMLRITHLKQPIPREGFIDLVALVPLTSYTET
jgi:hypothetical protein